MARRPELRWLPSSIRPLTGKPVDNLVAMTGEVSILGTVLPVGGIIPKLKAAKEAGAKRVLIPAENWQDAFEDETELEIIPVRRIEEVIQLAFRPEPAGKKRRLNPMCHGRNTYRPRAGRKIWSLRRVVEEARSPFERGQSCGILAIKGEKIMKTLRTRPRIAWALGGGGGFVALPILGS